jgi:hypothetical protein
MPPPAKSFARINVFAFDMTLDYKQTKYIVPGRMVQKSLAGDAACLCSSHLRTGPCLVPPAFGIAHSQNVLLYCIISVRVRI